MKLTEKEIKDKIIKEMGFENHIEDFEHWWSCKKAKNNEVTLYQSDNKVYEHKFEKGEE